MVRAILAGRKTVTRRVVKPQPAPNSPHDGGTKWVHDAHKGLHIPCGTVWHLTVEEKMGLRCPYGEPGDRLWVRETWVPLVGEDFPDGMPNVVYRAHGWRIESEYGGEDRHGRPREVSRWRPSIHMPRWASRLTLEVVSVRVERLHDITEEDARAEGVEAKRGAGAAVIQAGPVHLSHVVGFRELWCDINGAESWDANPWVWRVELDNAERQRSLFGEAL